MNALIYLVAQEKEREIARAANNPHRLRAHDLRGPIAPPRVRFRLAPLTWRPVTGPSFLPWWPLRRWR